MSLRRSYTDGPSESQKLYGSNLPPSLRWGAAKKHASAQSQEAIPKSELRARSHADPPSSSQAYKKRERRHHATADNASEHSKELGTRERSRAPYAVKRAAEEKTERLLLEDTPNPREADSRPHTTRERAQGSDHVIEWLEESEARVTNDEEHADATADTEKYKTRKHHVTVDHLDEAPRSDLRDAAAAAGAEDSDFVQDGPRVLPEHQQREHEHPKNTRDRHTDKDHPGRADNPNNAPQFERPPVYAKIHLEYLSTQTLKYYDIPWEYAKDDPGFIIILQETDKWETDVLFDHTRHLRNGELLPPAQEGPQSKHLRKQQKEQAMIERNTRRELRKQGLAHTQIDVILGLERVMRRRYSKGEDNAMPEFRANLVKMGLTYSQVDRVLDDYMNNLKHISAVKVPDNGPSENPYQLPKPRGSAPWFQQRWTVLADKVLASADVVQEIPASHAKVLAIESSIVPTVSDTSKRTTEASHRRKSRSSKQAPVVKSAAKPTLKRVVYSTYGDMLGNRAGDSLNPPGFAVVPQSCDLHGDAIYHSLHFQQDVLDFERFKDMVVNIPELREVRQSVNDHLGTAQLMHEQVLHSGNAIRLMTGFCHHNNGNSDRPRMSLISMPFLQLREYGNRTEGKFGSMAVLAKLTGRNPSSQTIEMQTESRSDTAHPTRTLFQYLNPRNNSRRDLKQAVCQMLGARDRRYLCVSQVWILVVNEELIITSSTLSESELFDDLLFTTTQTAPPKQGLVKLHITSEDGQVWLFKNTDCITYFPVKELAAHFADITHCFADDFELFLDDREITAHDWAETIQQACTPTVRLRLKRTYQPRLRSGSRGSEASDESSAWIFMPRPPPLNAVYSDEKLASLESKFPLRSVRDEESRALVESIEDLVKRDRQRQGTKRYARRSKATESPVMEYDEANSPVHDRAEHTSSATTSGDLDQPQSSGRKLSASEQHENTDAKFNENHAGDGSDDGLAQDLDFVYTLPEDFIHAKVLADSNLQFRKEGQDFILAEGLHKSLLLEIMRRTQKSATLKELRQFTNDIFNSNSGTSTGDGLHSTPHRQRPIETVAEPSLHDNDSTADPTFDENAMYQTCPEMTSDAFGGKMSIWNSAQISHVSVQANYVDGFVQESDMLVSCKLLGYTQLETTDRKTGRKLKLDLPLSEMYTRLLNGLRLTVATSKHDSGSGKLDSTRGKLFAALFSLLAAFHRSLESSADLPPIGFLTCASGGFWQLFDTLGRLEQHGLTIEMVHGLGRAEVTAEYSITLKHIITAVLLATKALTELEGHSEAIELEVVQRKHLLVNATSERCYQLDYNRVRECCSKMFSVAEQIENPDLAESQRQICFRESVDHLEELGWNRDAAAVVIRNECRWKRVNNHASLAVDMIEASFVAALHADPAKNIRWKAAALPTDAVGLLISRLLWRPVLDDQDALDMYLQYTTDLESNIFTAEPSREPLDRIRYLRHELNAFSQLQQEQIDVLEQITRALLPSEQLLDQAPNHPHPRPTVFATLPAGIQIQKDTIQDLSGMLDDLQSEARAQISGVQDWRDNAAVVFTIITVIFLPLSFVASVFGMNTTDIRNMALTQWVFWLSACSFTVVVVLITVYFVDVPPLWRWLERKGDAKSGNAAPPRPAQHSKDQFFVKLARQIEDKAAADSVNHGHAAKGDGSVTNDERESVGSFEDEA